jgi:hypothetical protein
MTSPDTVSESENAGRSWRLWRKYAADFTHPVEIIAPILDGNLTLAEALFEPLAVDAHLEAVDEIGYHGGPSPGPDWRLEAESGAVVVRPSWQLPETRVVVPAIDRAALNDFVLRASNQPADPGETVAPVALWVVAVRARLPAPWADAGDDILVKYQGGGMQRVPIERDSRGAWISGPTELLFTPPIFTYGRVQGVEAALTIDAHWSPWYEEGAAGTAAIERAVAALEAQGWQRS